MSFEQTPQIVEVAPGDRLAFIEAGSGEKPPVVLVHGSLCDYRYWQPQFDAIAAHRRVVSVSLPYYYPVADQAPGTAFSIHAHVDALAKLIDKQRWGKVALAGHSRGGCVAFHVASRYPEAISSLILADPGGRAVMDLADVADSTSDTSGHYAADDPRMAATRLIEQGQTEAGLEMFVDCVSRPGFWRRSGESFKIMAKDNAQTLPRQMRDILPLYTAALTQYIHVPTLLINGDKSPEVFRSTGTALAEWIMNAEQVVMKGASHGMNLSHANDFNKLLLTFLDQH